MGAISTEDTERLFCIGFETNSPKGRLSSDREFKLVQGDRLILVVEDEELIRMDLADCLRSGGFAVAECRSGGDAISFLNHAKCLHALLTDIRMGPGPNGWEVAHHARSRFTELPIVYVTGDSAAEWAFEGVSGSLILQKPFVESQVLSAICSLLAGGGESPARTHQEPTD